MTLKRFLFLAFLLAPAAAWCVSPCTPVSASITYEADDWFTFYVNGNNVINEDFRDAGAPPRTVSINPAFFSPAGTPDYFAAMVRNDAANLVGGAWVINISCADGSISYVTNIDNGYTMYDDVSGSSPPPAAWVNESWVDSGNLFSQTPIQAPPISWFNPPLTHPVTGALLPILSHSSSATQSSTTERLYFRQSIVLPVITATPSPTPYPTYPPGCGTPVLEGTPQTVFNGCLSQMSNTTTLSIPAVPNTLLVLRMEKGNGGLPAGLPSTVTYDGVALTLLRSDATYSSGGFLATYYLAGPHVGSHTLSIGFTSNPPCNWNVEAEIYSGVDQATPIGAVVVPTGTTTPGVDLSITTTGPASVVSNFLASEQGQLASSGAGQVSFTSAWTVACCEKVEGDYKIVNGPGTYTMKYLDTQANRKYTGHLIEIRGGACGTPSNTPSSTATPTQTAAISSTSTSTRTATPTQTAAISSTSTSTRSPTLTATGTHTLGPSPTSTATATPSATRSSTPSPSPILTPTLTHTAAPSSTSTGTPSPGPSPTMSPTVTISPSITPSPTISPTAAPWSQDTLIKVRGLYPNPFSEVLQVYYTLRVDAEVKMMVYNVAGEPIWKTSASGRAGQNLLAWKGENDAQGRCASGVYVLHFEAHGVDDSLDDFWDQAAITR